MNRFVVLVSMALTCLATLVAAQNHAKILSEARYQTNSGQFGASYTQGDGVQFKEESDADGNRRGSYSYMDPSGQQRTVTYTAGKDGFKASGDHLPVAPAPVPVADPVPAVPTHQWSQQPAVPSHQWNQWNSAPAAPAPKGKSEDDGEWVPDNEAAKYDDGQYRPEYDVEGKDEGSDEGNDEGKDEGARSNKWNSGVEGGSWNQWNGAVPVAPPAPKYNEQYQWKSAAPVAPKYNDQYQWKNAAPVAPEYNDQYQWKNAAPVPVAPVAPAVPKYSSQSWSNSVPLAPLYKSAPWSEATPATPKYSNQWNSIPTTAKWSQWTSATTPAPYIHDQASGKVNLNRSPDGYHYTYSQN